MKRWWERRGEREAEAINWSQCFTTQIDQETWGWSRGQTWGGDRGRRAHVWALEQRVLEACRPSFLRKLLRKQRDGHLNDQPWIMNYHTLIKHRNIAVFQTANPSSRRTFSSIYKSQSLFACISLAGCSLACSAHTQDACRSMWRVHLTKTCILSLKWVTHCFQRQSSAFNWL